MEERFSKIIRDSSTEKLKRIYLVDFLDYNESFVQCCFEELTVNRGVSPEELKNELNKTATGDVSTYIRNLRIKGKTDKEIERFIKHYNIENANEIIENINEEEKEEKEEKINNQILYSIGTILVVLVAWFFGYEIVLFDIIPVSTLLIIIGGIIAIYGLIKKLILNT